MSFRTRTLLGLVVASLFSSTLLSAADTVFKETNGLVAVEAEHFQNQSKTETRKFHLTTADETPDVTPDGDPSHVAGASGGAYLEILPDTRRTHDDKLIRGTNFSPNPGDMAVLDYRVNFSTPGRYYVWVRAFSTGSEDNGLHVGLNGEWPESGQRLQWCEGKRTWRWDSKQRTEKVHCGEPHKIYLDIKEPGTHTIHFSMREDGFEFDKFLMTTDSNLTRPEDVGPESVVHSGSAPKTYAYVAPEQTDDSQQPTPSGSKRILQLPAANFTLDGTNYYLDKGKWLAINPEQHKSAHAEQTFPFPTGLYDVTLVAIGENDGKSQYEVAVDDRSIGKFVCPLSKQTFEEGDQYTKTWSDVSITEGAQIHITSQIASADGQEFSRARWAAIQFVPKDAKTKRAAQPFLIAQATASASDTASGSPTTPVSTAALIQPRKPNGDGKTTVTGELKQWHKVTVNLNGPYAHEQDNEPNPFTDYRMTVTFTHADGTKYVIPGYFDADGNAANSSAVSGIMWRANFAPDKTGEWTYKVEFLSGKGVALDKSASSEPLTPFNGQDGQFTVAKSDKSGRDLRSVGRLQYVGKHYLQFAGSKQYFLKAGADAPETLLGYKDFDGTVAGKPDRVPLKSYAPHLQDWKDGDPNWKDGKGKGLIGAINYLSGKGCNAFSFLTYNAGGDGDNVWPFIQREDKMHYDCSKLDQWGIVFDHGTNMGMYLHFKLQETEMDDNRARGQSDYVPESLDGGALGPQRKLYCREMIARFGHNLALNWNLGEENTQSTDEHQAMLNYIAELDAYQHNRVLHSFPNEQDMRYDPLLGNKSKLTGLSLQNSGIHDTHWQTAKWVRKSSEAGKPWIVAFDESGSAAHAQCPDLGYKGYDGHDVDGKMTYTEHRVRQQTLWGTLMGGGAGVEYYFGYKYAENDLVCEDWRSRDRSWDYCRIAINFFHENEIPFWEMTTQNSLVGVPDEDNSKYCFAKNSETYLVYLANGGTSDLDLSQADGKYSVEWFNPRAGGKLQSGSVASVSGGASVKLGTPPADADQDWLVVVRKVNK
ncbi:DUF5060 domain-containing protein [Thalassoglobus sp. JC818]|uniref:DUF5060 domain-containing protein n=1 Tax=Thalassoglobus sp. JC818 TaxID=3232136 RepID=UPI00345942B7